MGRPLEIISPSQYVLGRKLTACFAQILYLIGGLLSRSGRVNAAARETLQAKRELCRYLLRLCPWWAAGHLELGLLELELSTLVSDKATSMRLLSGARLSAEAVVKLEGLPKTLGGKGNDTLIVRGRALQGLVLIRHNRLNEGLDILKHSLALNNESRLTAQLRLAALEAAGSAALVCGDEGLALEFLNRAEKLSPEAQLTLESITSR